LIPPSRDQSEALPPARPSERSDPAELRNHYEAQGRRARETGQGILCSEPTISEAVKELLRPNLRSLTRVLDVGCGANLGYDLFLAERGIDVVAVDFSTSFLELAPRHPRIELRWADATALPFENGAFDAVICSETAEHVPDDRAVLREIARVLLPGGLLIFTVPLLWNAARILTMIKRRSFRIEMMEGHLREYTRARALEQLRQDFDVEEIRPVPFGWRGPVGTPVDLLIRTGVLSRASKSFAVRARRKAALR
jgi:SAM-dependent methyltransferase